MTAISRMRWHDACCWSFPVDPISSTSGIVRLVRRPATFRRQNFPRLTASSRTKIQAAAGPPLRSVLTVQPSFPIRLSSPR